MKRGTYVIILFLIFFILLAAGFAAFLYLEFGRPPAVRSHSYLEIQLSGELKERAAPDFLTSLLGFKPPLSMYDIWLNFQKAERDRRIQAVVLKMGHLQCDWAKVNEIREMVKDFRKTGKKVYAAFEETVDADKEYFLATACDRIVLHPLGQLYVNGIGGYIPFFKRGLDRLGVEFEVEHVEEYKTAMDQFTEEGFTPANKEMLTSLFGDIYSKYIEEVAAARGKTEPEVRSLIDHGFFQGIKAQEAGIVDELLYEDELTRILGENGRKWSRISHERYMRIRPSSVGLFKGRKIALVYGMGPIITGEGTFQAMGASTVARWIRNARRDKSVAAIVFRVDSPGGSAVGSDVIWREMFLAKKQKPVVVSMSDVAGSGGYWVSMAAHKIIAQPQTLTGSIGVVFGKPNLIKLYDKLGITAEQLTFGKRADIFSSFRKWTPEERRQIKEEIRWMYDRFLTKVAEGRNMSKEEVDRIGKGRVWTGRQALERGLVDEMGGLSEAVARAKELAGIPVSEPVRLDVHPKRVSFLDMFLGRRSAYAETFFQSRWARYLPALQVLGREHVWALMPLWETPE